jgi:hypothetical protein
LTEFLLETGEAKEAPIKVSVPMRMAAIAKADFMLTGSIKSHLEIRSVIASDDQDQRLFG